MSKREKNKQRHLEESKAKRERSRLDTVSRLNMAGAICKRGEEQGKDHREGIVKVQEQGKALPL